MIYFDNAATSFPKPKYVIKEVNNCLNNYCGNPGRSSHKLAVSAAMKIYETREKIAEFLDFEKSENIVFTSNATHALNLVIKGLIKHKCHIITSDAEHNSVLRPLFKIKEMYGAEISFYDFDNPSDSIPNLIRADSSFLITTIASNVTGKTVDLKTISDICDKYKLKLIIDASQYLGHLPLSLKNINFSALCSAGHKALFGLQGSGFVVFGCDEIIDTLMEGGSGIDTFSEKMPLFLPERFEAGTLSTPAIISLGAGIDYINAVNIINISEHLITLSNRLSEILHSFKNITIHGCSCGIAAFTINELSASLVANKLDEEGIAVRSGYHCAPTIHSKMGLSNGTVRISLSYLNKESELDELYKVLKKLTE